jgi:hypothetical protein
MPVNLSVPANALGASSECLFDDISQEFSRSVGGGEIFARQHTNEFGAYILRKRERDAFSPLFCRLSGSDTHPKSSPPPTGRSYTFRGPFGEDNTRRLLRRPGSPSLNSAFATVSYVISDSEMAKIAGAT